MPITFDQNFVPGWNTIYTSLIDKVSKTIITANEYTSPFSAFVQSMETGNFIEDIHINPGVALLQDTVTSSAILEAYIDDIAVSIYPVSVGLQFPSTVRNYVVRTGFTLLENVSEFISSLTANIRTTLEFYRNNLVKQMFYNAYQYGMLSSVLISDPRLNAEAAGEFAIAINTVIDDFRTEMTKNYVIYNNQVGIAETDKRITISNQFPFVITFNNFIRFVEFNQALNLGLVERMRSGNTNQDWSERIIRLDFNNFPNSIPPINMSDVVGDNVPATDINFFEMPVDIDGNPLFSNTPTGGDTICALVVDPDAIKLYTQLQIQTSFHNAANLDQTEREIYRGVMELGAFNKICAITCNDGQLLP